MLAGTNWSLSKTKYYNDTRSSQEPMEEPYFTRPARLTIDISNVLRSLAVLMPKIDVLQVDCLERLHNARVGRRFTSEEVHASLQSALDEAAQCDR